MTLRDVFGDGSALVDELVAHVRLNGLMALLAGFDDAGDEAAVESWVGRIADRPIDAGDVKRALGRDDLSAMAERLGATPDEVAEGLARVIPTAVDAATPDGRLPRSAAEAADAVAAGLAATDVPALLT